MINNNNTYKGDIPNKTYTVVKYKGYDLAINAEGKRVLPEWAKRELLNINNEFWSELIVAGNTSSKQNQENSKNNILVLSSMTDPWKMKALISYSGDSSPGRIVFVSGEKHDCSTEWKRTTVAKINKWGALVGAEDGKEWKTDNLIARNLDEARLILQKLKNGSIRVEEETQFGGDSNGPWWSPGAETDESNNIKEKLIESIKDKL